MNKVEIIIISITAVIFLGGIFLFSSKDKSSNNLTVHELFWSSSCPHCQIVEDFLSSWEKRESFKIEKIQVDSNTANVSRLVQKGKECKLPQSQIGSVPLLVAPDGKCFLGDTPIIDYLKSL